MILDIQMPDLMGTDFVRMMQNGPKVIFATATRSLHWKVTGWMWWTTC
jgi:DNA-binding response OmpR family regulator